jgi:CRISPR-associated protein Csb1
MTVVLSTKGETMNTLTYETLLAAVAGDGVALRARIELEPVGGPGDKVFPPTYGVTDSAQYKYATEKRRVNGETVESVVLNSVAAEAKRHNLVLSEAIRAGDITLPQVLIDFAAHGLPDLDGLSDYEAPHRIYDAILRDSLLDGLLFRFSEPGRAITEATPRNAAALFHFSPIALLFGSWDSTGPRGGRGSKFERAMTSEIVAFGVEYGVKTSSRLDPLGIEKGSQIFTTADPDQGPWTLDADQAKKDSKGNPELFRRSAGDGQAGNPSHINHGNIAPSIDARSGGVTIDTAVQTLVLSMVALRRLRFPANLDGEAFAVEQRSKVEPAARAALAAMGLAAAVLAYEEGYDLRSRCVLAASAPLTFELLHRGSSTPERFTLDRPTAIKLVDQAAQAAADSGLGWRTDPLHLQPADRLVTLVKDSRARAESSADQGD